MSEATETVVNAAESASSEYVLHAARAGQAPRPSAEVADAPLTIAEMRDLIAADLKRLERAGRDWAVKDGALNARLERVKVEWGRQATDAMFDAVRRDHEPDLIEAERAALHAAEAARQNALRVRRQVAGSRVVLPASEMATAATRLPLVKHDVDTQSLPSLAAEVRGALASGDTVALYLFAKPVPARLERPRPENQMPRAEDEAAKRELQRLLARIAVDLRDTAYDPIEASLTELFTKQSELQTAAGKRQRTTGKAYTADGREKVAWPTRGAA